MKYDSKSKTPLIKVEKKKPITSIDYINRMQHRYGEAELNESNKMKDEYFNKLKKQGIEDSSVKQPGYLKTDFVKVKQKPFLTPGEKRKGYAQLKKYATQPNSKGVWKQFVKDNEARVKQGVSYNPTTKLFTNPDRTIAFQNKYDAEAHNNRLGIETPKVKPRRETESERIERTIWETSDTKMPKPYHMKDHNIIKEENWKKKPEKWDSYHNISDDQKQQMSAWEDHLEIAKKPKTPEQRRDALDTKRMLNKTYYNLNQRKSMAPDELRIIGKHPDQLKVKLEQDKKIEQAKSMPIREPIPIPKVDVMKVIRNNTRMKPGLTEDLLKLNTAISKNIDYVLNGDEIEKEERSESEKSEDNNNKEETYD